MAFKESNVRWTKERCGITDSGYTGIKKLQNNTKLPKKSSKKKPLTKEEKEQNRKISSERVVNENVIGSLKRFKIIMIDIEIEGRGLVCDLIS